MCYGPHEAIIGDGHAPRPFLVGLDLVAFDLAHTERLIDVDFKSHYFI